LIPANLLFDAPAHERIATLLGPIGGFIDLTQNVGKNQLDLGHLARVSHGFG
jgi:hypothetical protein